MSSLLTKDAPTSLPRQLRDLIVQRIEQGQYQPGRKLDSIRQLAQEFSVSTLVVNQALKLLEAQQLIVRVPAKGVFVTEDYQAGLGTTRANIALAFPESAISPNGMPMENWAIVSEIHRGLLAGAVAHHAQVRFEHFSESESDLQLSQQLGRLKAFDAAVFIGHQLGALRQKAAAHLPVIQIGSADRPGEQYAATIDYDRTDALGQLARHVAQSGYQRHGIVSFQTDSARQYSAQTARAALYRKVMAEHGLSVQDADVWQVDIHKPIEPQLAKLLQNLKQGFVFCNHAEYLVAIYQAARTLNLRIGPDVGVACVSTGFTFQGASPACTYLKTPLLQMGQTAVQVATELLEAETFRTPRDTQNLLLKGTLMQGQSTVQAEAPAPLLSKA